MPGQAWQSDIIEQIEVPGAGCKYVIDELKPDGLWLMEEDIEFPDPEGKGVLIPLRLAPWPLPGRPLPYESESALFLEIIEFLHHHLELRDKSAYDVLACFILVTWRFEEFDVVPYLNFLGPKNTGKTRGLELVASLAYRGWLITHPTPAAVFWIVDRYHPTLLEDNYEFWAKETRRELDGLFNAGYRKGAVVPRRPRERESGSDLDIYNVYCPKGLSGTREPSDALGSRCIRIRMTKTRKAMPMRVDGAWAKELRSKLLQYRFRHLEEPRQENNEILNRYGRVGEIFHALLTVAPDDQIKVKIAGYAQSLFQDQLEEEATSQEAEAVQAIVTCQDEALDGRLAIKRIVEELNKNRDEKDMMSPEKVGWITKRLGFKKCRMPDQAGNYAILLESSLVESLREDYDIKKHAATGFWKSESRDLQMARSRQK